MFFVFSQLTVRGYWKLTCVACGDLDIPTRGPNNSLVPEEERVGIFQQITIVDRVVYNGLYLCRRFPTVPSTAAAKAVSCFRCAARKCGCVPLPPAPLAFTSTSNPFLPRLRVGTDYMTLADLPYTTRVSVGRIMKGLIRAVSLRVFSAGLDRRLTPSCCSVARVHRGRHRRRAPGHRRGHSRLGGRVHSLPRAP